MTEEIKPLNGGGFPAGVYFQIDETDYHDDPALGSSDHRNLLKSGADYWYYSALNPARPREQTTPQRLRGQAIHVCVLRGREEFDRRYACEPTGDDVLYTSDDIKAWLRGRGVVPRGDKSELIKRAMSVDMKPPRIYDALVAEATREGKIVLSSDDYNRAVIASAMIGKNPRLANVFTNGMPEVAVFWQHEDLMYKALIDYLKVGGIGDLKSISNTMGLDFVEACRRAIATYRYDMQAVHYLEARAALPALVEQGKVWGTHDAEWLRRVAGAKSFAWQWVFYQGIGAPITWSTSVLPDNPALEKGRHSVGIARQRYRECHKLYGGSMWVLDEPVTELDINELPPWFVMLP